MGGRACPAACRRTTRSRSAATARSNIGRAKTVYRNGLSWRYGRRMQTISGIHYNWSLPGLGNAEYFALIRNFRRHGWLLFYLFGASPAVCSSFVAGRSHALKELRPGTLLPAARDLAAHGAPGLPERRAVLARGELQRSRRLRHDPAAGPHARSTRPTRRSASASRAPWATVRETYRQLSTTLLQIENEFYGKIRPKRRIRPGERPLHALRERGVEYVEVRLMDLDPFAPVGITRADDALPRRVPAALPAHRQPARHAGETSPASRATRKPWRSAAASRA